MFAIRSAATSRPRCGDQCYRRDEGHGIAATTAAAHQGTSLLYYGGLKTSERIHRYGWNEGRAFLLSQEDIGDILTLDLYFESLGHRLGDPRRTRDELEEAVRNVVSDFVSEMRANMSIEGCIEMDLLIRCRNQVGIIEVKAGRAAHSRRAVDHLNTSGLPEFAGRVHRFLFTESPLRSDNAQLATGQGIHLLVVGSNPTQSPQIIERIGRAIHEVMGPP